MGSLAKVDTTSEVDGSCHFLGARGWKETTGREGVDRTVPMGLRRFGVKSPRTGSSGGFLGRSLPSIGTLLVIETKCYCK